MSKGMRGILLALPVFVAISTGTAFAAKAPAKKAPAKPRIVKGTTQLNGDQAQIGLTYTLGKTGPINVTVNSIEYTIKPVRFGNDTIQPKPDEKLMVIHYTLHNPNKSDYGLRWSTLNFQVVDSSDTNWRFCTNVGMEGKGEKCNMSLKPAQKTALYTAVLVPAKGEMPKLIIESADRLVLRYDLRGKVKGLPAPIADPSDPSGATALKEVPAQMGEFYTMTQTDVRVDSAAYFDGTFKGRAPKKGNRCLAVIFTAKNTAPGKIGFRWSTYEPKLVDQDGMPIKWNGNLVLASRDDNMNGDLEPGQEVKLRYVFEVPNGVTLKTFSLADRWSRTYVYDVSSVK